jgi:hypothetical protein
LILVEDVARAIAETGASGEAPRLVVAGTAPAPWEEG